MAYNANLPIRIQAYLYSRNPMKEERNAEIAKDLEQSVKLRVAVLTSLKVYQEMTEMEPPAQRRRFELIDGHLNGPSEYHKITAFELWREIVMFL